MELPKSAFLFRVTYTTRMRNDPREESLEPLRFSADFLAESVDDFKEAFDRFKRERESKGLEFTYMFFTGRLPTRMLEGRVFQLDGNEIFSSDQEVEAHLKRQDEYNTSKEQINWKNKLMDANIDDNYGRRK